MTTLSTASSVQETQDTGAQCQSMANHFTWTNILLVCGPWLVGHNDTGCCQRQLSQSAAGGSWSQAPGQTVHKRTGATGVRWTQQRRISHKTRRFSNLHNPAYIFASSRCTCGVFDCWSCTVSTFHSRFGPGLSQSELGSAKTYLMSLLVA